MLKDQPNSKTSPTFGNVVAIIPARSGSKGVKDKNIKQLRGRSLLEWSIRAAQKANSISRIFLSTDSSDYAKIGRELGAEVPFLRPDEISGDGASDLEFVLHAVYELEKLGLSPDYLVHLRPTTPLRQPEDIDEAVKLLINSDFHTSLRSVHKMSESSYKTMEIHEDRLVPLSFMSGSDIDTNAPRQSFPDTYQANGYVDVLNVRSVIEHQSIHGPRILPYVTEPAYEIDSPEDFLLLEYIARDKDKLITSLFEE